MASMEETTLRSNSASLLALALKDRCKEKCNMRLSHVIKTEVLDLIRESGDRGRSTVNFITNWVLFLANISMMLADAGYPYPNPEEGWSCQHHAEGDDGAQFFSENFIEEMEAMEVFAQNGAITTRSLVSKSSHKVPETTLTNFATDLRVPTIVGCQWLSYTGGSVVSWGRVHWPIVQETATGYESHIFYTIIPATHVNVGDPR